MKFPMYDYNNDGKTDTQDWAYAEWIDETDAEAAASVTEPAVRPYKSAGCLPKFVIGVIVVLVVVLVCMVVGGVAEKAEENRRESAPAATSTPVVEEAAPAEEEAPAPVEDWSQRLPARGMDVRYLNETLLGPYDLEESKGGGHRNYYWYDKGGVGDLVYEVRTYEDKVVSTWRHNVNTYWKDDGAPDWYAGVIDVDADGGEHPPEGLDQRLPYKGLSEKWIDHSGLGPHDAVEEWVRDYENNAHVTCYVWLAKNGTGDKVFSATVVNGRVDSVLRWYTTSNYWTQGVELPNVYASGEGAHDKKPKPPDPDDYESPGAYADNEDRWFSEHGYDDPWDAAYDYWVENADY